MTILAATVSPTDLPSPRRLGWMPDGPMIRAEQMKLTKRRGLMAAAVIISSGAMTVAFVILVSLHASNSVKYAPAGGMSHLVNFSEALSRLAAIVAILIGATAGAGDLTAGFFRNLVVTGRSRLSLFLARVPGGLIVLWPIIGFAFAIVAVASVVFAGPLVAPSAGLLIKDGLWIEVGATAMFLVALGTASIIGSRSTSISVLLALELVATPILSNLSGVTWLRQLWLGTSLGRLEPLRLLPGDTASRTLSIAAGSAISVIIVWSIAALAAGARRTMTRDA
jgi:hypothetical protein